MKASTHYRQTAGGQDAESLRVRSASWRGVAEASQAESRVLVNAAPAFDEFLLLRFRAENVDPFRFAWADQAQTAKEYGALLVRLSREYDSRFA